MAGQKDYRVNGGCRRSGPRGARRAGRRRRREDRAFPRSRRGRRISANAATASRIEPSCDPEMLEQQVLRLASPAKSAARPGATSMTAAIFISIRTIIRLGILENARSFLRFRAGVVASAALPASPRRIEPRHEQFEVDALADMGRPSTVWQSHFQHFAALPQAVDADGGARGEHVGHGRGNGRLAVAGKAELMGPHIGHGFAVRRLRTVQRQGDAVDHETPARHRSRAGGSSRRETPRRTPSSAASRRSPECPSARCGPRSSPRPRRRDRAPLPGRG